VYSNEVGLDEILLHIVPADNSEEGDHRIRSYLQARLRVSPHIHYLEAEQLQKMQFPEAARKAIKFIDRRK
jgi:phenylacetate-CoA ligase